MGLIHVLPEAVANKIAAGEVVERPASIVKELIENSIDAGATSIELDVKNGGKSFIRISDNGCGMSGEDAELAFKRHATSKISSAKELETVRSFGFRGEALPSIAAVSRVRLSTREKGKSSGVEIQIEGGKTISVKEKACAEGTAIEIRDLFFNTPARRKFVRTDPTELGHIQDTVVNLALANTGVRFVLRSSSKILFDLLPATSILERARSIWPEEEAKHLIEAKGEGRDFKVSGVIGKPFLARGNRSDQSFYVNKRWIRSIGLSYALQDGYHGLLMHGQYPVGVLFIEVDPARVDVNVHPTKQEVRLSREAEIKSLIRKIVTEALQKEADIAPALKVKSFGEANAGISPMNTPYFSSQNPHAAFGGTLKMAEPGSGTLAAPSKEFEPILIRDKLKITKILGQIHHTFLIAETEEGMIVVDQHAAHERVMFEAMLREFESDTPKKQGLLMDEVLELKPKQIEVFKEVEAFLSKLGFDLDAFGENAYVLRSYPACLEKENPIQCLKLFLEQKESELMRSKLEVSREDIAALIACKRKSVKAHETLTHYGIEALLQQLAVCENPFNCPHGRPTFFKHSFDDLEKQFKRK